MRLLYGLSALSRAWIISLPLSPWLVVVVAVELICAGAGGSTVLMAEPELCSEGAGSDVIERDCFIVMAHCDDPPPAPVISLFRDAVDEDDSFNTPLATLAPVEVVALGSSFITGILLVVCDSYFPL